MQAANPPTPRFFQLAPCCGATSAPTLVIDFKAKKVMMTPSTDTVRPTTAATKLRSQVAASVDTTATANNVQPNQSRYCDVRLVMPVPLKASPVWAKSALRVVGPNQQSLR